MRRLTLLVVALTLAGYAGHELSMPEAAAAVEPDPVNCTGYPEPRVFLESQTWWSDSDSFVFGGNQRHVHVGVCVPLEQVIPGGPTRFDLVVKLHNYAGSHTLTTRVLGPPEAGQPNGVLAAKTEPVTVGDDATLVRTYTVDLAPARTGRREFKFHAILDEPNGASSLTTNSWPICVRSCNPDLAPDTQQPRGAGWYRRAGASTDLGYLFAVYDSTHGASFPWRDTTADGIANAHFVPLHGIVGFPVQSLEWPGPPRNPIENDGYSVHVDPDFHHGSAGIVLRDTSVIPPTDPRESVRFDTRRVPNGRHRLVIITHANAGFAGQFSGVFVVPFEVGN